MAFLLEVSHLSKTFYTTPSLSQLFRGKRRKSAFPILTDVHLNLEEGELYCLMGPNGSGKTTFLKILCGLILPDTGIIRLSGKTLPPDHPRLRAAFGLVTGEERSFYWRLTGRQNLEFFSAFYPMTRKKAREQIEELSNFFQMESYLDKFFFIYSTGMKQRLGLCRGLLGDPKILFLDEPTRSLDPTAAEEWRHFLRKVLLEKKKKTILYTTHHVEEAEGFSNRIGILHRGRLVVEGDSATLRKKTTLTESASLFEVFQKVTKEATDAP